jgi:hypothetical protein
MREGIRMYSTKYIRGIAPILVNAVFFAVLYLVGRRYLEIPGLQYLVLFSFLLTLVPLIVVPVEYEVYTQWEETFLKFWKTQHFRKEIKRRRMLLGILPVGKEESVRVERTLQQPPIGVVLNDVLGNAELLIPIVNTAVRLIGGRRP